MKIAISGLHGQGKTTLLNRLKEIEEFKDFNFKNSPTRALLNQNFKINESGTQDTQMTIMLQHYLNQLDDNTFFDRCSLDGMAYTLYFTNLINITLFECIRKLYYYTIQQYDLIFYIEPEIPLVSDGTRSIDRDFFNVVRANFEYLIKNDKIKIISISGTVEQRAQKVLDSYKLYTTLHKKI